MDRPQSAVDIDGYTLEGARMTSAGQRYDSLFQTYAEWDINQAGKYVMRQTRSLDWKLLKAQAMAESALNPRAVSPAGAQGLFQFMPSTWQEWALRKSTAALDPFNPEHSTFLACAYMEWLLNKFNGDIRKALAAYNWGPGNVSRAINAHDNTWEDHLPLETSNYLRRILG